MPWTAEVRLFTDSGAEKRVIGTLIWDAGGPNEFRYSAAQTEITVAAANELIAEAKAARDAAIARRTREVQLATQLATLANA